MEGLFIGIPNQPDCPPAAMTCNISAKSWRVEA